MLMKIAVETLQESVKVCQSRSHSFHFPCSVIPCTHQTFSFTASIVLFPDPLENTASIPHRINPISVNPWVFCCPSNADSSNCCHSWDNIPWEFPGRWKALLARIDYMMHYCKTISRGDNSGHNTDTFQSCPQFIVVIGYVPCCLKSPQE